MGNIFRTIETKDKEIIVDAIKYIATDKVAIKEMGEPFIVSDNQTWLFCYHTNELYGFCAYTSNRILYFYTLPKYRGKGVFNTLYNLLPNREWQVISSNLSYSIFLKKGFRVIKNYVNCHRLIKTI